jgi:predicted nucleotidyltransferase
LTKLAGFVSFKSISREKAAYMVKRKNITDLSDSIAHSFKPERIILFGSYAYGNPGPDSDVDILVIMPFRGSGVGKAVEIIRKINLRIPVDIIVRTPKQIRQRLAWNDFFLKEIMAKGKVLYESPRSRVGGKS